MRIGVPSWLNRVSPVMDTALQMIVLDLDGQGFVSRQHVSIPPSSPAQMASFLRRMGVDLLICGAVSRVLERHLRAQGVEVIPWVRGDIDAVTEAYQEGRLEREEFALPGCPVGRRQRGGRRGKGRGGRGRGRKRNKEDLW